MSIRSSPPQGVVARILTGHNGKQEFYPQVLICLVGEGMPVVAAKTCRTLAKLRRRILKLRHAGEHADPNER